MNAAYQRRPMTRSFIEATARHRIAALLDPASFREILGPAHRKTSPHIERFGIPAALDDGAIVGTGTLGERPVFIVAQEGAYLGGAVGEVHGAKIVGLLRRVLQERNSSTIAPAILLLIDSGGVRLHEANAGLIAISEIMRATMNVRAAGLPIIGVIGGSCGAFGGMGIVAQLCTAIVMSEQSRMALSGPEVIETVAGVEEFDSRDRALVWRVTGGRHRYIMGDCDRLVRDDIAAFRKAIAEILDQDLAGKTSDADARLRSQHQMLAQRLETCSKLRDGTEYWRKLGIPAEILDGGDVDKLTRWISR